MSAIASAFFAVLGSKLVLSMFAFSVPFIAVAAACYVFHSGGDING